MKNANYYMVFDFETLGTNPHVHEIVQIGSVMLHPRTLEITKGSEFCSWVKPDSFDGSFKEKNLDVLNWHAKNFETTVDDIYNRIENAPSEKHVWDSWVSYMKEYYVAGKPKRSSNAPILAGFNIFNFDKIIFDRLAIKYKNVDKHGSPNIYQSRDTIDVMKIAYLWNESNIDMPNLKADTVRQKCKIEPSGNAHDALYDAIDTAEMLSRYLRMHRNVAATRWGQRQYK